MAGSESITFPDAIGQTGPIGLGAFLDVENVRDLFSNPVAQSPGSSIIVEEQFTIGVQIDTPSIVDVDMRWFGNRPYLGTYRTSRSPLGSPLLIEEDGFITAPFFIIRRESSYLLRPPNSVEQSLSGSINLRWCNLQLVESAIQTTVNQPPVPGLVAYATANAMTGTLGRLDAKIGDGLIIQKLGFLGLFLNAGVTLNVASYNIGIAPQCEAVELQYTESGACVIGGNCDSEFAAFLETGTGFATPAAAIAAFLFFLGGDEPLPDDGSIAASEQTFACTNGETRLWYTVDQIIS